MDKEKLRSEIDDIYKWDLSKIYKDDDAFAKDLKKGIANFSKIKKYKGILLNDANTLYEGLTVCFNTNRVLDKLYTYAHLNNDSESANDDYKKMYLKMVDVYQEYETITSYIVPELLTKSYSLINKYYKINPRLIEYKTYLKEVYRYKNHTLSMEEEKVISSFSSMFKVPEQTFTELTDIDLKFEEIKDENDQLVVLNDKNYNKYLSSSNQRVRKEAFNSLYNGYKGVINTISSLYYGNTNLEVTLAKIKKYGSALEMALYDDKIDASIYNNLIETVSDNLDKLFNYYKLRKNVLKLDDIHLYDLHCDLIKGYDREYTFKEAKELVINSLQVMGDDYIANINKAFDEKWIDIYSNKSKRSGAYSSGCYDTNPYILLNYQGKLNDVSTVAHELGHSMHSYYSNKNNSYVDAPYKIFVAEVASTVNELLLYNYMLKISNKKEEKLAIINKLLDLYRSTIYRQTMFAEFEKITHEMIEKKEVLTSQTLNDIYLNLNKKYFGPDVVISDMIQYEWARIPHFYYFFYVYKYATGLAAATYIALNILKKDQKFIDSYIEFLKSGNRDYPIELLKIANVDMNDKRVIVEAIEYFDSLTQEFIKLYNS